MPAYSFDGLIPIVDPSAFVHPTAVLIGDVSIGPGCYIGPGASLRGDFGRIVLEKGANVQDNCIMHSFPSFESKVEENGHIGHGAVLHGCIVRRDALVGMNSVLMDGAIVGEASFVAAMSFVKAKFEIPPRTLVAGIPAKVVRELTDQEIAWKAQGTAEYQELARVSLATLKEVAPLTAPEPGRQRRVGTFKPKSESKAG
jgi:phenylacetic acid degradation protein